MTSVHRPLSSLCRLVLWGRIGERQGGDENDDENDDDNAITARRIRDLQEWRGNAMRSNEKMLQIEKSQARKYAKVNGKA